jgi:beta-lysine 5,6-aminomutase beta subunit
LGVDGQQLGGGQPDRAGFGSGQLGTVKGFAGEKGLEYYREIKVVNLDAQVLVPDLVARARAEKADAILVSQVVTQRDAHLHNTRELAEAVRAASWPRPGRPLVVAGGTRFDVTATEALGVDRIFGKGTTPGEVACGCSRLTDAVVVRGGCGRGPLTG